MSRDASITLEWADGEYTFRFGIGEWEMLQEATDCGPHFLLNRLSTGTWKIRDIRDTIRVGLIGGGMEPTKALKLVRDYVDNRPPMENIMLASGILSVGLYGAPDGEKPGEAEGEATASGSTTSPTENSE